MGIFQIELKLVFVKQGNDEKAIARQNIVEVTVKN